MTATADKECPKCGKNMLRHTLSNSKMLADTKWVCVDYPKCNTVITE